MLGKAAVIGKADVGLRNAGEETPVAPGAALRPFILRRTKEQVAKDLPAKTEQTIYCDLEPAQRKLYDELREHYRQLAARPRRRATGSRSRRSRSSRRCCACARRPATRA